MSASHAPESFDTGLSPDAPRCVVATPYGELALVRLRAGEWVAADAWCPHLAGPLWEGVRAGADELACPWHGWRFSLRSGRCTGAPSADRAAAARASIRLFDAFVGPAGTLVVRPRTGIPGPAPNRLAETMPHRARTHTSILDAIGDTPLVQLRKVGRETGCRFLAKCEFLNAGGSVKDRIGKRMVLEAEKSGRIQPGDTLIEPTSGNTGIGMALAAAVRGYRMIITMPEKMSREKQVVLEALGAEIIRTPTEAPFDSPESHIGVAKQLHSILPNSHILDQYSNPDNPAAHYEDTAGEILAQTDGGNFDAFVATAGTGGTLSGCARRLKEEAPHVKIVGVDPVGSILAGPGPISSYKVEGIGYDFIPDVLDRRLVDQWVKTEDRESFNMARKLIRQEGLLCGGSSGSAVWAAVQVAKQMGPGKTLVVILPDSVRNYMTKFLDDRWMRENGFSERGIDAETCGDLVRRLGRGSVTTASSSDSLQDAVRTMKQKGISQLPVLDGDRIVGIVTESDLLGKLVERRAKLDSAIAEVMFRNVHTVHTNASADTLLELFAGGNVGLVVDDSGSLQGILTKMDLVDHLTAGLKAT